MTQYSNSKQYDLEERTFLFARNVAIYCKELPFSISNKEYIKQVVRSSGSIGANYIEANECLSKKDFNMRIKICRKEAKETVYWLRILAETNENNQKNPILLKESIELKKIFSSIVEKTK